jgi:hypothetical protein
MVVDNVGECVARDTTLKKKRGLIFFDKAALCFSDNPVGAHSERSALLLYKWRWVPTPIHPNVELSQWIPALKEKTNMSLKNGSRLYRYETSRSEAGSVEPENWFKSF